MPKPLPILSQMPWNVKQLIVDSGDTETKIALRPVSKEFKGLVSRSQISYKRLSFQLDTEKRIAAITFVPSLGQKMQLGVIHEENGYKVWKSGTMGNLVRDKSLVEEAVNQFVKVLRNPKVLIEEFEVLFSGSTIGWEEFQVLKNEVLDSLRAFFASLAHPIRVRYLFLHCDTQHDILKVLPFLQAGTLEVIKLWKSRFNKVGCDLSEIAETEQWKSAKDLEVNKLKMSLPIEKWSHFSYTSISTPDLTVRLMKSISNSFINSTQWKLCTVVSSHLPEQSLIEYFTQLGTQELNEQGDYEFKIPTPNSQTVIVYIVDGNTFFSRLTA